MASVEFSWLKSLASIRKGLAGDADKGLGELQQLLRAHPLLGFELELVGRLLSGVGSDQLTAFPVRRVAVLSNFTSEPLANALRVALLMQGILGEIYEAPFDSCQQEILSSSSGLYAFQPDLVLVACGMARNDNLPSGPLPDEIVQGTLDREIAHWQGLWSVLAERLGKPIIQHMAVVPEEESLGVAERRERWAAGRFIEALNQRLIDEAPGFVKWLDVDRLAARVGRSNWHDPRLLFHGKFAFSSRFLPDYAVLLGAGLRSVFASAKKALILDLDNTLWGGVVGDDGIDGIRLGPDTAEGQAYQAFCEYLKGLARRGVVLGICSKNEIAIASEVFQTHPHMPLKLEDFAVVSCNWENKASNLSRLAKELNIDISSLVFVDDNPAECELVRQSLPQVHTVQLDGDPALFIRQIDQQHLFDSQAFSPDDLKRASSYQARAKSAVLQAAAPDLASYLASLDMTAVFKPAGPAELPRLAQMEAKTNQFNLSTRRLGHEQLKAMAASPDTFVWAVFLTDRFADHGLVSYVAATLDGDRLVITDWLMSCRVFSRTLEQFIFNVLVAFALGRSARVIALSFSQTGKNKVMEGLFESLGMSCAGAPPEGPWQLDLTANCGPLDTAINRQIW